MPKRTFFYRLTAYAVFVAVSVCNLHAGHVPPVVHSAIGDKSEGIPGKLQITNIGKKQQFNGAQKESWDNDINSPKSVTFSPDGKKFYVNSLEGGKTVVYDALTFEKIAVINHEFTPATQPELFAPLSGYYEFTHYPDGATKAFMGKPVESSWSHNGRYLWVPYYRRTFDLNAQDPSAIAVIDARDNKIIRVFETGPLPKMVETSHDGKTLAVTHWGNNTVGFIDISGNDPEKWHHLPPVTIGHKLDLNFSLTRAVNRDSNSGYLLRGTVFTPDDRYLLISSMSGPLHVVDMKDREYLGTVNNMNNIRHLVISGDYLYGSQNTGATVLRVNLDSLLNSIDRSKASGVRNIPVGSPIKSVAVGGGARTLSLTPDGRYAFVACNSGNALYVVDTETMTVADHIRCDSYPVGLELSPDGHRAIVTSQGRSGNGGNAVNIFAIDRFDNFDYEAAVKNSAPSYEADEITDEDTADSQAIENDTVISQWPWIWIGIGAAAIIAVIFIIVLAKRPRKK